VRRAEADGCLYQEREAPAAGVQLVVQCHGTSPPSLDPIVTSEQIGVRSSFVGPLATSILPRDMMQPQLYTEACGPPCADTNATTASPAQQQQPPAHVRPSAGELADLFTSLSPSAGGPTGGGIGNGSFGSGVAAASQQQQSQTSWSLQPQPQPQPQKQSGLQPQGGLANGGSGHARKSSGSGAFDDLDFDVRKNVKPMGERSNTLHCSKHSKFVNCCASNG